MNSYGFHHNVAVPGMELHKTTEVDLSNKNIFDHKVVAAAGEDNLSYSSKHIFDSRKSTSSIIEDKRSGLKYGSTVLNTDAN